MTTTDEAVALVDAFQDDVWGAAVEESPRNLEDMQASRTALLAHIEALREAGLSQMEQCANLETDLSANRAEIERLTKEREAFAKVIDADDRDTARMARIIMASVERLARAEATITELRKALKDAHEALRPFAEQADEFSAGLPDDYSMQFSALAILSAGHYRRARAIATEVK